MTRVMFCVSAVAQLQRTCAECVELPSKPQKTCMMDCMKNSPDMGREVETPEGEKMTLRKVINNYCAGAESEQN